MRPELLNLRDQRISGHCELCCEDVHVLASLWHEMVGPNRQSVVSVELAPTKLSIDWLEQYGYMYLVASLLYRFSYHLETSPDWRMRLHDTIGPEEAKFQRPVCRRPIWICS